MQTTEKIRSTLATLPSKPGVYVFKDMGGAVLYVGKAKSIRNRVRSYFHLSTSLEVAKRMMVSKIADLEYIIVDSEIEALLLESTLIKKYRPPYNIIFRDDKYYQYIRITLKDDYPRVDTIRRILKDGSRYFGPFTSSYAVRQTLQLLKRIFPYRSCNEPKSRPCFDARLGRCLGHDFDPATASLGPPYGGASPSAGRAGGVPPKAVSSPERYRDVVHHLIRWLEGDVKDTIQSLRKQMKEAAANKQYELAAQLRDRIFAVQKVVAEQKVVSTRLENEDVIGLSRIADLAAIVLFQIRQGKLLNRQNFILQHVEGQTEADIISSFSSQYYSQSTDHPTTVLAPVIPADGSDLERILQIPFHAPRRGKKRKLVLLAETNARDFLQQKQREWLSREARAKLGLTELQQALLLTEPPKRIECYDISNVQGTNAVGSMVVFEHGLPKKSDYRKFKIATVKSANDYAMLQEVLRRRFGHHGTKQPPPARGGGAAEPGGGGSWPNPDLIIVDGGKGQLNAALVILRELRISIPTIALAKREEEIFRPGQPESIRLTKDSEGLFLIQRIRDEAHRFAIGYYRQRHGTAATKLLLDEVPGIGPKLKKLLLQKFGSVDSIRAADDAELEQLLGKKKTELLRQNL